MHSMAIVAGMEIDGLGNFRVGFDIGNICCSGDTAEAFLTGDFTCCSGLDALDECGVCNGSGSTCKKSCYSPNAGWASSDFNAHKQAFGDALLASGLLPDGIKLFPTSLYTNEAAAAAARRRLLQTTDEVTYTKLPDSSDMSSGQLTAYYTTVAATESSDLTSPGDPEPQVTGEADNGVCENGEPEGSSDCITPQDCPAPTAYEGGYIGNPTLECAGNGACNRVTGTCVCAQGYSGDACDRCDIESGYADVPTATDGQMACTRLASDFTENSGDAPAPAALQEREGDGLSKAAIAGAAIGAVAGVALIGGGGYYLMRKRGAQPIASSNQQV